MSVLNVCWNIKENIQKSSKVAPLNVMLCSMAEIDTSTSQEHCTVQVTTTLLTTLLPDRVTFIFPSREIVTALGNRIYFHLRKRFFISAFCFYFVIFHRGKGNIFSFLIENTPRLFEKKFCQTPVLTFEFRISWLV